MMSNQPGFVSAAFTLSTIHSDQTLCETRRLHAGLGVVWCGDVRECDYCLTNHNGLSGGRERHYTADNVGLSKEM